LGIVASPQAHRNIQPSSHIESLFDILGELYALGARRFAERSTEDDRKRLRAAQEQLNQAAEEGDILGYYPAFLEYSRAGLQGSKNPLLEEMLLGYLDASMRRTENNSGREERTAQVSFKKG
jgi:DNA-binding GntR family transcriptional regulator